MNEFIEKLIGRLEEKENEAVLKAPNTSDISNTEYQKWMMKSYGFKESIGIVNQIAEEYGKDTNVHSNGWIPCIERLPKINQRILVFDVISGISIEILGEDEEFIETVIAWQPLPAPFKPKGE